ncbi:MAG: hypothetical protein FXF54_14570 [Kosmotoga sp.]|nr:MAG: hypothetical protein FXF54_14570 [Kosmotoga sp.]
MNNLTFINDELSMLLYYNYSSIDYNSNSLKYAESILKRSLFYKPFTKNIEDLEKAVKSITELELFSLLQSLRSTPEMISNKTEFLISFAGKSSQIDFALGRLLGSAVNSNILSEKNLRNYLRNNWLKTNDERLLESFLKISMLSEIDFLSKEDVEKIIGKKSETDLLLAFSDYCSIFEKREFVTTIHSLFNELIDYNPALSFFFEDNLKEIDNKRNGFHLSYEWNNLTNLFKDFVEVADSTLLQFMFYGDPAMTGKKNTGGLTTFLIALGNELSKKMNVITIGVLPVGKTNTGKIYKAISKHHTLLRIPLYITHSVQNEFIDKFTHIKRMIKRLLEILPVKKLKAHLRYSDHASLAAAETLKALSNKVFFTITADPHIKMVNSEGKIVNPDNETASIMLSRLYASEEIVKIADRLIGIGTGV